MKKQIDFLAVGDITVDSFIRLKEAHVISGISREQKELCMSFADKIPYEFVEDVPAVGNSGNASVSAARLGLSSALVSDVGNDEAGKQCIAQLQGDNVNTEYITVHNELPTNHHFVLWYQDERTILVKHTAYPYKFPDIPEPRWMYLSSIGQNSEAYHEQIADYLENHTNVKLAFQPGTFQMNMGKEKMKRIYKRAELVAVNVEEAQKILGSSSDPLKLLDEMREIGPNIALITDGVNGAYLHDGKSKWHLPIYPDKKPPYSRTGAGDATASSLVSAIAIGKDAIEGLKWGHVNAQNVVQQVGAQKGLLTREAIENALQNAPAEFKEERIS